MNNLRIECQRKWFITNKAMNNHKFLQIGHLLCVFEENPTQFYEYCEDKTSFDVALVTLREVFFDE